uniref:G_PROTEIN_RECEP_F1_2 domain-containing protein n=1 Tax=Schistosoma mansoni TaxID=6183 RepID=A0A5K4FFI1_SCHMA
MNVISDIRELIIISSIDIAIKNLKMNEFNYNTNNTTYNDHNSSTTSSSSSSDSSNVIHNESSTYSTISLKEFNKIMSIEANNIDAITVIITQSLCLLLILSSACINPILYGWLNKTFRMEFYQKVFSIEQL